MEINQGDVYWISASKPTGSSPGFTRPFVVIQNNVFNHGSIGTVLTCALTTNLRRANAPGNILLNENEAGLPRQSVIVVSQLLTIDKAELLDKIGILSKKRVEQILDGIKLLIEPREIEERG